MVGLDNVDAPVLDTTPSPCAGNKPTAFGELPAEEDAWPQ